MKKPFGYISYTHGLDGKVKIVPMIEPDEFQNIVANSLSGEAQKIFFQEDDKYNNINIFISAFNGKSFICKINNIENIEDVKSFLKKEIFIDVEDDDYIDPEKLMGFVAFDYKTKQEIKLLFLTQNVKCLYLYKFLLIFFLSPILLNLILILK